MSTDELLARLARLDQRDLSWLLGELPPALRRELAGVLSADDDAPPATIAPATAAATGWESLDAGRAADVLVAEPVWLISAATRSAPAAWREKFLHGMPARRRHDIELADRSVRPLGARAGKLLLDGCRARIDSGTGSGRATAKKGFADLVAQMRNRIA